MEQFVGRLGKLREKGVDPLAQRLPVASQPMQGQHLLAQPGVEARGPVPSWEQPPPCCSVTR